MFRRWLIGDMGTPGEYMYQPIHLYSTAIVIAVFLIVCVIAIVIRNQPRRWLHMMYPLHCIFTRRVVMAWQRQTVRPMVS